MNTQEYISSGIVESYVLGLSSEEEKAEFEKLCALYPEILEARKSFAISLEKNAMENAVAPPEELKKRIFATIEGATKNATESRGKVVNFSSGEKTPVSNMNWLKYAAAACLIFLLVSVYFNLSLSNKNKKLQSNTEQLQQDLSVSSAQLARLEEDASLLQQNPNIKMAALQGTPHSPRSFVTVYWDTTSKDVYLLVNNLPTPATDKQYQLWALLNGKPVDMGMIDMDTLSVKKSRLLLQMKNVQNAQAFAITLEKKGGSPTPTMEEMYVQGKL